MKQLICIALLILLPFMAFCEDLVKLKSGIRYKGKVIGSSLSKVYMSDDSGSIISIPRNQVTKIYRGSREISKILLTDRPVYYVADPSALSSVDSLAVYITDKADSRAANAASHDAVFIAAPIWVLAILSAIALVKK